MQINNKIGFIDEFLRAGTKLAEAIPGSRKTVLFRGVLGELLVWKKLLEKGLDVELLGAAKKEGDIKLNHKFTLDVKEKTGDKWVRMNLSKFWDMKEVGNGEPQVVKKMRAGQPDYYVLCDSQQYLNNGVAAYYVFTKEEFCEKVKCLYNYFDKPRPKNNKSYDFHIFPRQIADYKDDNLVSFDKFVENFFE